MSFNFILSCLAGDYLQAWISPPVHPWMVQIIIHFIFQILKCFMTFLFDINHSLLPLFDKYESFIFLIHVYMLLNTYIVEKINGIAVVWDLSLSDTHVLITASIFWNHSLGVDASWTHGDLPSSVVTVTVWYLLRHRHHSFTVRFFKVMVLSMILGWQTTCHHHCHYSIGSLLPLHIPHHHDRKEGKVERI